MVSTIQPAVKDEDAAPPLATEWREWLRMFVSSLVRRDTVAAATVPSVVPITPELEGRIQKYVASYDETLTDLPEESWSPHRRSGWAFIGTLSLSSGPWNQAPVISPSMRACSKPMTGFGSSSTLFTFLETAAGARKLRMLRLKSW
jgi:hypothetical protein